MMTQENKDLLYKDLCARLPYYVRVNYKGEVYDVLGITNGRLVLCKPFQSHGLEYSPLVEEVKPYLFPLSSMTDEQYDQLYIDSRIKNDSVDILDALANDMDAINWLLKNHFDIYGLISNGLISMGLAIDATNLNIY